MIDTLSIGIMSVAILFGIYIYVRRRARLLRFCPSDFPSVPARDFLDLRNRYVRSTEIVLGASIITFVPLLISGAFYSNRTLPDFMLYILGAVLTIWISALAYSALIGNHAHRKGKKIGINWTRKV